MRQAKVVITDDFDGTEINPGTDYEPLRFMVDGTYYEIDLTDDHRSEFFELIYPWTHTATEVPQPARLGKRRVSPTPAERPKRRDPALVGAIRTWARERGYKMSDRGRIPAEIERAYELATRLPAARAQRAS